MAEKAVTKRKSEANRKTWRATSIVYVLFLILCARSLAAEPKTIAFLEEHTVAPGMPHTVGALYVVPRGRKAHVSNMFCEIRSFNDPGYSQIVLVVFADTTITGPATDTAGMNPLNCVNFDYITTKTSSAGFKLLPGNWLYALHGNFGITRISKCCLPSFLRMICNYIEPRQTEIRSSFLTIFLSLTNVTADLDLQG
jgi:hypothetical protein